MFANERHAKILSLLKQNHSVTVTELIELFNVSFETVRRDLERLEKEHLLKRVHGGAVSLSKLNDYQKIETRLIEHKKQKDELSQLAATYINEGDFIAIDTGATAVSFAHELVKLSKKFTVATNSPEVFSILKQNANISLIMLGGQYLQSEEAFYGFQTIQAIKNFHFTKSFVFPSAISCESGMYSFVHELYDVQVSYLNQCDRVYILADSSKFEKAGTIILPHHLLNCTIITDSDLSQQTYERYLEQEIKLIKATKK